MQARASHDIQIRIQVQTPNGSLSEKSQVLVSTVLFDHFSLLTKIKINVLFTSWTCVTSNVCV